MCGHRVAACTQRVIGLRSHLLNVLTVGFGGFLGANLRYAASIAAARLSPNNNTIAGTLAVNVVGSLLLGVFLAWAANRANLSGHVQLLVATGFFGSLTTFSTFANESTALLRTGMLVGSLLYVIGTNVICLFSAALGFWIGNRL